MGPRPMTRKFHAPEPTSTERTSSFNGAASDDAEIAIGNDHAPRAERHASMGPRSDDAEIEWQASTWLGITCDRFNGAASDDAEIRTARPTVDRDPSTASFNGAAIR